MAHDASTASTINMQPEAIFTKKILCYLVIGYATFRPGRFGHGTFRSRGISVRLWHLAEILHVHFLTQTCLHQQKVLFKKTTNIIQDPTVNQHQHMIFIIISKQIKSLSTFCN